MMCARLGPGRVYFTCAVVSSFTMRPSSLCGDWLASSANHTTDSPICIKLTHLVVAVLGL